MKRIDFLTKVFSVCILLLLFTCEQKFKNPLDPNTELKPDEWAPKNLNAEAIDDSHIRLTWTQEEPRIEGFIIERKDGSANYRETGRTDTTVFIDDSLKILTSYIYRISAYAEKNKSTPIVSSAVQTFFPAPTELSGTNIDDQSVKLNWKDNCAFETGYRIERKSGSSAYSNITETDANTTEYNDTSLAYRITYTYRVSAITKYNVSGFSNELTAQTIFPAPTNLAVTAINDQSIRITWVDNCSFESGFRIERKTGSGEFNQVAEVAANATSYEEGSLTYGETYTYRVRAYTSLNQSDYSNENSAQMIIPAPTDLNAVAIDDQTTRLTWTDNCSFEIGYRIERKIGSGDFSQIAEVAANTNNYEESGLIYGETYTYRVRTYTSINQSGYSNESTAQMIISAPTNLSAIAVNHQTIRLTWIDNCLFESGFRLERDSGRGFEQIIELGTNLTTYTDEGLTYGQSYTYRVCAFTANNISEYSNTIIFGTNIIADIDGNFYRTVTIGAQEWMAENLKVTHYRNGDAIPNITGTTEWINLTTDAYCNYDNNSGNVATYGRLYNWYTVNDNRNIAPEGWHIPSDTEWQILVDFLGGEAVAGGKLKEAGTTHWENWESTDTVANNESGFSALPAGWRDQTGAFVATGQCAVFWSSTESDNSNACNLYIYYYSSVAYRGAFFKACGFSIRCVKD